MSCTIGCPYDDMDFEFRPERVYKCKYSEGRFTPQKLPKCVEKTSLWEVERSQTTPRPTQPSRTSCNTCNNGNNNGNKHIFKPYTPQVSVIPSNTPVYYPLSNNPKVQLLPNNIQLQPSSRMDDFECNPSCQNGGTCIFHDKCRCTKDFVGSHCQYNINDRCSLRKKGFNGEIYCSINQQEAACTINCPIGIEFEYPKATVYKCNYDTDEFTPSNIPKCVYGEGVLVYYQDKDKNLLKSASECDPPCQNNGICVGNNICRCLQTHRGPDCQYPVDNCNFRKTKFNGSFYCTSDEHEMKCQIACPAGFFLDGPAAGYYVCQFDEGIFHPNPVPKCIYGELINIMTTLFA